MTFIHRYNHIEGGDTQTSMFLMNPNSLRNANGVNVTHELGAILKDPGYVKVGNTAEAGKSILGMFDFIQVPGTQKTLITVDDSTSADTQLFYNNAGTWTEIGAAQTDWTNFATMNVEMESFIGYCFFVGHGSTDGFLPVGSLTGTTFSTSTNVTSMAQGKYIKRYRDRLYVANARSGGTNYPFRVYFSSVPSAGSITWTAATNFFDVGYSEEIKGLAENWDMLVIFTEDRAYYYNQTAKKKLWDEGCTSHRSIKNNGASMFWVSRNGVFRSNGGGTPENISGQVQDFFRNANTANSFAEIVDEEYHIYLGTVTVRDITYTNLKMVYNIPLNSWRWRELGVGKTSPTAMTIFAKISDKTNDSSRLYMGNASGIVSDQSKYTDSTVYATDEAVSTAFDGIPIHSRFELAPFVVNPETMKSVRKVIAYAERAQGLKLNYRVIDSSLTDISPYQPLMQLDRYINEGLLSLPAGSILQIEGTENGSSPYWKYFGASYDIIPAGKTNG